MKKILLAAALGLALTGSAEAQSRSDYYRSGYFAFGMFLRASVVCNNKSLAEYGFNLVGSQEFRAFSAAYPETLEKWMREGGENFNRGVMKDGIPEACKFMISRMKRG
jgi:hypothetical protein